MRPAQQVVPMAAIQATLQGSLANHAVQMGNLCHTERLLPFVAGLGCQVEGEVSVRHIHVLQQR